jgi:2'-hydroxyisoflavone reductase
MDVLVLGGSVFLGRAVVAEAQALGANVTVFNRGQSGITPAGATHIRGDRTDANDLEQLRGLSFDRVVDTSGYVPFDVGRSAAVLADTCGHYAFVSTVNAYPGWPEAADYHDGGIHDGDPDATRDTIPAELDESASYGWLKVGCERAAARAFGADRTAVLRGGCIVGPDDSSTGRLPWWIARVARGGEVLVPGSPGDPMSLVDARDLARFALQGPAGTYETTGPDGRDTRADLMQACLDATGSDARFTYVDEAWLAGQDVEPWTEVPLWAPGAPSLFHHDASGAEAAGFAWRPLRDTVADTWRWQQQVDGGWQPGARTPGLDPAKEAALLSAWHARTP